MDAFYFFLARQKPRCIRARQQLGIVFLFCLGSGTQVAATSDGQKVKRGPLRWSCTLARNPWRATIEGYLGRAVARPCLRVEQNASPASLGKQKVQHWATACWFLAIATPKNMAVQVGPMSNASHIASASDNEWVSRGLLAQRAVLSCAVLSPWVLRSMGLESQARASLELRLF